MNNIDDKLLDDLNNNSTVCVDFVTKTGKTRRMLCTRLLSTVPPEQYEGMYDPRINGQVIATVYDLEIKEWRAFRWDSVIVWKIYDQET